MIDHSFGVLKGLAGGAVPFFDAIISYLAYQKNINKELNIDYEIRENDKNLLKNDIKLSNNIIIFPIDNICLCNNNKIIKELKNNNEINDTNFA